jgi:sulfhydrogenase subunit beta (sulfur reductase)
LIYSKIFSLLKRRLNGRHLMLYNVLDKKNYKAFLTGLINDHELIGPKKINKAVHDFVPIKNFEEIDTDYKKTTLSPAKKILFPASESLISYKFGEKIEIEPINACNPKILFGINAWDLNGMNFLDRIFTIDFIDENYVEKRENLIVIGMDTDPNETNFALKMGAEYANEGFDLFFSDLGDRYFVRVATEKGIALLKKYGQVKEATKDDFKDYNRFMDAYRSKFQVEVDLDNFHDNLEIVYNNQELWDKLSEKCFSCGSCNLTCPTCFCFDVRDDMKIDLREGIKSRQWDSCMIPEYGLVAGGHNFRPTNANRLKQRYRCKLKTFVDKFGKFSCVGCGRCVEACLAKINIYEDINSIKKEVSL